MNQLVEKTLTQLTGKAGFDEVSLTELEQIAGAHPYFIPAQVLLAQKLKISGSDDFLPQVQKTALYFTNPHLLHFRLLPVQQVSNLQAVETLPLHEEQDNADLTNQELTPDFVLTKETLTENLAAQPRAGINESVVDIADEVFAETPPHVEPKNLPRTEPKETDENAAFNEKVPLELQGLDHPPIPDNRVQTAEVNAEAKELLATNNENEAVEITEEERPARNNNDSLEAQGFDAPFQHSVQPQLESPIHKLDNPLLEFAETGTTEPKTAESNVSDDEYVLAHLSDQIAHLDNRADDIEKIDLPEPGAAEEVETPAPDPFHPEKEEILEEIVQEETDKEQDLQQSENASKEIEPGGKIANYLSNNQPHSNSNTLANEPLIPIEPYHTVDYFASQGIKLQLDKNPKDRLGKQLRSFTEWLKHMKRIGPEDTLKTGDPQMEAKIQGIADSSNITEEVTTEAMAEVLVKQGKTAQAIEVYDKLSFLNPGKSAYFADKIKKLKGI